MVMMFTGSIIMVSFIMCVRQLCFLFRKGDNLQKYNSASISAKWFGNGNL